MDILKQEIKVVFLESSPRQIPPTEVPTLNRGACPSNLQTCVHTFLNHM